MSIDQQTIIDSQAKAIKSYNEQIARLRAANKKLRAELVEERSNFDVLESGMRFEQAIATAYREAHKQLARQLAEAIGGKAK